ncbi:MAG: hypothetical protein ABI863_17210, partial [Ginsengibacter sp.]
KYRLVLIGDLKSLTMNYYQAVFNGHIKGTMHVSQLFHNDLSGYPDIRYTLRFSTSDFSN